MSGSVSSTGQTSPTTGSGAATGASASDALTSLSSNFSTFLKLLMTQLQNQDPTSPMDTSQFTTELVQFSGVEQQISTNASLGTLIQLTQGSEVVQATAMLGHKVTAASSQLALQNGSATVGFTAPAAGPVGIVVTNSGGSQVYAATVNATAGSNSWSWNGQNSAGAQLPDGAYAVSVIANTAGGSSITLPTTITGTATGVGQQGSSVQLDLGGLAVDFSKITSVGGS